MATNTGLDTILKCTICYDRLNPPIKSCLSGHNVCGNCTKIHKICKLCKAPLNVQNNQTLDLIIEKTLFPCIYQEIGCVMKSSYKQILLHEEKECQYRTVRCILGKTGQKCNEVVLREEWSKHLLKCPYKQLIQNLNLNVNTTRTVSLDKPTNFIQTVFKAGDLFFVESVICNMESKILTICYHHIGRVVASKKYIYTVTLDTEKIPRAWKFTNFCMPFLTTEYNIKMDNRTANVDPNKFLDKTKPLTFTIRIETIEEFNNRKGIKKMQIL